MTFTVLVSPTLLCSLHWFERAVITLHILLPPAFLSFLSVVHARSPFLGPTCWERRYQVTSRSRWTISNNNLKPKARRRISENLEAKGTLSQKNNKICHWSVPVSDQKYNLAGGTVGQSQAITPAWAALIDQAMYLSFWKAWKEIAGVLREMGPNSLMYLKATTSNARLSTNYVWNSWVFLIPGQYPKRKIPISSFSFL